MLKKQLRKIHLARRRSLSATERREKSLLIKDLFFERFDLSKVRYLHAFLPIEKFMEVDTRPILEKLWRDFPAVETLVPRVNFATGEIESLKFSPETKTARNVWQIDEPTHDETVEAELIDLVLVPLVCFDRRGFRVGYGKGFYDRFLARCRADCRKIGLDFFGPVEEISDADRFDIPLDACITPDRIWNFSKNR
jgi:5-formyltetrahydrofolate cyclo-ligase